MTNAESIMLDVLQEHAGPETQVDVAAGYRNAPFGKVKELPGAKVRKVGLDFITRLCDEAGLICEFPAHSSAGRSWQNPWDVKINEATFAVKASTEHVHGRFQFNHIQPDRSYEAVLCLGIASDVVLFDAWPKADVVKEATGKAVAIDQMSPSRTLRKHRAELKPIEEFEGYIKPLTESLASRRYRLAPETERRKIDLLVHLGLHEIPGRREIVARDDDGNQPQCQEAWSDTRNPAINFGWNRLRCSGTYLTPI